MGQKLVVGPNISKGLKTDRLPFVIDNDSFPVLLNAYQWRGRVKRKRGTSLLGRLTRYLNSTSTAYSPTATIALVAGAANILTGFSLQATGNIVPGSVTIVDTTASNTYTDDGMGNLTGTPAGTGTINYATGAVTITGGGTDSINATFIYYPGLPVMGIEDLVLNANQFPGTLEFDTVYSYNQVASSPYSIYDVSFYKNPPSGTYPSYVQKTTVTPTSWNGQNYQQFWTVNYQGALWATNGITVPFVNTNIGMQYKAIVSTTIGTGGPPATVTLNILLHGLVVGDFVFVNEVATTTGINFQTGYVITVTDANNVIVEFPNATIATNGTGGIAQYLTSRANPALDCLRWYDGDPTNGSATNPVLNGRKGWVNFAPPLSDLPYSIADLPAAQYYLVGARMIIPFKDRLLFIGPVIQTSSASSQVYLQDTVIYSQNGTPYYTCSFTGSETSTTTVFNPILTPTNETGTASSYFEDVIGYGGFITAGFAQPLTTVGPNEDVLIQGFSNRQARFVYTGNDISPFNFFIINSELGSGSTFSSVIMDRGIITIGEHGIVITSQISAERIDLDIPDQVFQFNLTGNGVQRVAAQRDFINEWIYFTYNSNEFTSTFPNQTLQYNYRDGSWAMFNESYTTYGQFRKITGNTWTTIGQIYPTWADWNDPWNAGVSTLLQAQVLGGNQQGFVLIRGVGTGEGASLSITSFSGNQITSPNHGLNNGDYIQINGCIGTIGTQVNGNTFSVNASMPNTFTLNPPIGSGTYVGGGTITRMYVPFIQTKQFPMGWDIGRKTRIGPQMYLLTSTARSQIELQIYLSQDVGTPWNAGPIVPSTNSQNDGLIYSDVLYTCVESSNLGLTPANTNLQQIALINSDGSNASSPQNQIWHRVNTSLIGDTVQLGFTMNDSQMRAVDDNGIPINAFAEIELHGFVLDVNPSQWLS